MEVGPTKNRGFWDLPREPAYDTELIAIWRLYARLHERLREYTHAFARVAAQTGMPIVRPLFFSDPRNAAAWSNWWTYQYGSELVVSPIWQKGQREQQVYLPSGAWWRNAWLPNEVHSGGKTVAVHAEAYQIPLFVKVGSPLELGDLNQEYVESQAIAQQRPDLKALDAQVKAWFESSAQPSAQPRLSVGSFRDDLLCAFRAWRERCGWCVAAHHRLSSLRLAPPKRGLT